MDTPCNGSGVIHVASEFSLLGYLSSRHAFRFFLLQAVGIHVETMVIEWGSRLPVRWPPTRAMGYLWVLTWFFFTAPYMLDPPLLSGLAQGFSISWASSALGLRVLST
ncbi:hypothetical protein F5887DRAFT_966549 [Amanita rubescens]|nr:hypothetical protein F5887DRAFT_966549 [Amanita rubescens]